MLGAADDLSIQYDNVREEAGIISLDPGLFAHLIILDGQIVGGWKRTLKKDVVLVEVNPITKLTKAERRAIAEAAERYGQFLGLGVNITQAG